MAKEELDLAFHLGDYIYEVWRRRTSRSASTPGRSSALSPTTGSGMPSTSPTRTLQAAHARCPWVVTWDDHEFENNYANDISEKAGVDPAEFLEQRANAYQAYYETMPLRSRSVPHGPHMTLYRTLPFGRLADVPGARYPPVPHRPAERRRPSGC